MKPALFLICLILAFTAHSEALPGMRGNGASGAIRDRDPSNPFYRLNKQDAIAVSSGKNPKTYTFTAQKGGNGIAIASASNTGGGPVSSSAMSGRAL